jgi:hypothetical protein
MVHVPADVSREDRVLADFTARQLAILASTGVVLWAGYWISRTWLPLPAFFVFAVPIGTFAIVVALGRRDGIGLDRWLAAGVRHRLRPRRMAPTHATTGVVAPPPAWLAAHANDARTVARPGPLRLPARGVRADGAIDLGPDGAAVLAVCSTVNFALRLPEEQESLVAIFARYLNSLTGPMQVLVRAERLDVSEAIAELEDAAPTLPHPALEQAATGYGDFLDQLAAERELLRRQVVLAFPTPAGATDASVARRRAEEAVRALAPAGIAVTVLDGAQTTALLSAAIDPYSTTAGLSAGIASNDSVIAYETTEEESE